MDGNLQQNLIKYHNLILLSYVEEPPEVKEKWLKKLRNKIISYLDVELTFSELYKILNRVEKEGFGFYIKPLRCERLSSDNEKLIFQQVEVGMRYMGASSWCGIEDVGFIPHTEKSTRIKNPKKIRDSDIVDISNIQILENIKSLNKNVYKYVLNYVFEYLYERIDLEVEYLKLKEIMVDILGNSNIPKHYYSLDGFCDECVCIEKDENTLMVYTGEKGQKNNIEYYLYFVHACDKMLYRLSDSEKTYSDLKRKLVRKIKNIN